MLLTGSNGRRISEAPAKCFGPIFSQAAEKIMSTDELQKNIRKKRGRACLPPSACCLNDVICFHGIEFFALVRGQELPDRAPGAIVNLVHPGLFVICAPLRIVLDRLELLGGAQQNGFDLFLLIIAQVQLGGELLQAALHLGGNIGV